MAMKRHRLEEIVAKLHQVEVLVGQGRALSHLHATNTQVRGTCLCHTAWIAIRHSANATSRKIRSVRLVMRWRWT